MAVTPSVVRRDDVFGNLKVTVTDVELDDSYTEDGYALTADDLGLHYVFFSQAEVVVPDANMISARYDAENELLLLYGAIGAVVTTVATITVAELVDESDVEDGVVQVIAYGY